MSKKGAQTWGRNLAEKRMSSLMWGIPEVKTTDERFGILEIDETDQRYCMGEPHGMAKPMCMQPAGWGTQYRGVGWCRRCGGNTLKGKAMGAWMMAHGFAGELDVTPWDALLIVLRRASRKAAWYQIQLGRIDDEQSVLPGGDNFGLAREAERADALLAKYAKTALDAGVAERLVQQYEVEGGVIAKVLMQTLQALQLSEEEEDRVRAIMSKQLLALEGTGTIEGEVINEAQTQDS